MSPKHLARSLTVLFSCLVILMTALPTSALANTHPNGNHSDPPTKTVIVKANQDLPGLDTGIDVASGSSLTIEASGKAAFGTGSTQSCTTTEMTIPDGHRITANGTLCSPKADSNAVLPSAPVGELIAKIGSSEWFRVGSSFSRTIQNMSGQLFLLYNDVSGLYGNNSGSYRVKVTSAPPVTKTQPVTSCTTEVVKDLQQIKLDCGDKGTFFLKAGQQMPVQFFCIGTGSVECRSEQGKPEGPGLEDILTPSGIVDMACEALTLSGPHGAIASILCHEVLPGIGTISLLLDANEIGLFVPPDFKPSNPSFQPNTNLIVVPPENVPFYCITGPGGQCKP